MGEEKYQNVEPFVSASHAMFMADAVVFILNRIIPFSGEEVRFTESDSGVFVEMGHNRLKVTDRIIRNLEKHKTIALYALPEDTYDPNSMPVLFELEDDAFEKLKEIWKRHKESHRPHVKENESLSS